MSNHPWRLAVTGVTGAKYVKYLRIIILPYSNIAVIGEVDNIILLSQTCVVNEM